MPKIVDVFQKKTEIMHQAALVFAEKGYYDATLLDVAHRCGMGRTTLYQYFANKEELFTFVLDHVLQGLLADMQFSSDADVDAYKKLQLVFWRLGQRFHEDKHLLMVVTEAKPLVRHGNEDIWQRILAFRRSATEILTRLLTEGMDTGQFVAVDSQSMAATLYLLLESLVVHLAVTEESALASHLANLDFFLNSLRR